MLNHEHKSSGNVAFVCMRCGGELNFGEQKYTCKRCSSFWPVVAGVPVFLDESEISLSIDAEACKEIQIDQKTLDALRSRNDQVTPLSFAESVKFRRAQIPLLKHLLGRRQVRETTFVKRQYETVNTNYYAASLSGPRVIYHGGRLSRGTLLTIRKQTVDLIQRHIDSFGLENPRIIEFGMGDGINLWFLNEAGWLDGKDVVGFDYALRRTYLAKQAGVGEKATLFCGNARAVPFSDGYFDVAFSVHALEQMNQILPHAIAEMARVAKRLVLLEPFYETQTLAGKAHNKKSGYASGIRRLVESNGYEVRSYQSLGIGMPTNVTGLLVGEKRT